MPSDNKTPSSSGGIIPILWAVPTTALIYALLFAIWRAGILHVNLTCRVALIGVSFAGIAQVVYRWLPNMGSSILVAVSAICMYAVLPDAAMAIYWILSALALLWVGREIRKTGVSRNSALSWLGTTIALVVTLMPYFTHDYAQPFNAFRLSLGQVNADTLQHATIAAMIKSYQMVSHGLHGLAPLEYHFGSHLLMAGGSRLLLISIWESYSYFFVLFCLPLLGATAIGFAEELSPSRSLKSFLMKPLLYVLLLLGSGVLNSSSVLAKAALWPDFYDSESYTLSLVFMFALFSVLFVYRSTQNLILNTLVICFIVASAIVAKISVGIYCVAFVFFWAITTGGQFFSKEWWKRFNISVLALVVFLLLRPVISPVGSAGSIVPFQFVRDYVQFNQPFWAVIVSFIVLHNIFPIIAGIFFSVDLWSRKKSYPVWLAIGMVFAGVFGLCIVLLLRIKGGSASYFSAPAMFMAFPFLLTMNSHEGLGRATYSRVVFYSVLSVLTVGFIYYAPTAVGEGRRTLRMRMGNAPADTIFQTYIEKLTAVRQDSTTKDLVVFIPKDQKGFWSAMHCNAINYVIPGISERASLYNWPNEACYDWLCGERFHSSGMCEESQKEHGADVALQEAKRLGYAGVAVITFEEIRILR